jgi:hypothetical protein
LPLAKSAPTAALRPTESTMKKSFIFEIFAIYYLFSNSCYAIYLFYPIKNPLNQPP